MANWQAYRAIKAEAAAQQRPHIYQTDITTHDRSVLAKNTAPDTFIWALRECGTDLLRYSSPGALYWAKAITYTNPTALWYVWADGQLQPVGAGEALQLLADSLVGLLVYSRRHGHELATVAAVGATSHRIAWYVTTSPDGQWQLRQLDTDGPTNRLVM